MKPTPVFEVIRRIRLLAPHHKVAHLRGIIASESKRSIRRVELEEFLQDVINKELKREIKRDNRKTA
jgi:hypothetical protein